MTFDDRINEVIRESKRDLNYIPHAFLSMIGEYGILTAVKMLINNPKPSEGYLKLWENKRLDLSVEAIVLEEDWGDLFTDAELEKSKKRLVEFGYFKFENANRSKWTREELKVALEAYIEMLDKQEANESFVKSDYNKTLRMGLLGSRTRSSVEYRMQNISSVFKDFGLKIVKGYLPAENVGINTINELVSIMEELNLFSKYKVNKDIELSVEEESKILNKGMLSKPMGNQNPKKRHATTDAYERNPLVKLYVLQRANGKCELCNGSSFYTDSGDRYLEVHHLVPLSENGPDIISNAVALCPNCHRELHYGKLRITKSCALIEKYK